MTKKQIIASLFSAALAVAIVSMSGIVDASAVAQATGTRRPTRDRTTNPRATREPTQRPTRDRTTNPRATRTPEASETPLPAEPTATDTAAPIDANKNAPIAPGPLTSQLLILNPDRGGTAKVTVNVFDSSGAVAFSDAFKLKENGAKLVTLPKSVGNDFLGSARVTANRRVQALVLDSNADNTASDTYEVSALKSNAVTLPFVRHLTNTTQNTLIAIQNTFAESTDATFRAYDETGAEILSHPVTIPANASAYLNTDELFGAIQFVGSARITANHPIVASALSSYMQDTASLRALHDTEASARVIVPGIERKQRKDGIINAWNEMYIRNNGNAPTDITVAYYNQKGQLKTTVTRTNVPAGGLAMLDSKQAELDALGKKFAGWANVTSSNDTPLAIAALAARARGKQLVGINARARERVTGRAVCGDVRISSEQKSVLTIVNTVRGKKARVRVRFYSHAEGAPLGETEVEIAPNGIFRLTAKNGLPNNFQGIALLNVDASKTRFITAFVTTQTLEGKRVRSTSAYTCS